MVFSSDRLNYGTDYKWSRMDVVNHVDQLYPHAEVFPDGRWQAGENPQHAPAIGGAPVASTVVVFSSDATYYAGLVVAMSSFRRHHPEIHVVIIDCGLSTNQALYLSQYAEVKPATVRVAGFPALARFEVSCLPYERIIYLDSDIVVLKRLQALLETDAEFAAVSNLDWKTKDNFSNEAVLERYRVDPGGPAFNSGVFVLDNRVWGRGRLLREALTIWEEVGRECLYADQSVLHILMHSGNGVTLLDNSYNAIAEFWDWQTGMPHIVHFAGDEIKPWDPRYQFPGLELFFEYSKIVRDIGKDADRTKGNSR